MSLEPTKQGVNLCETRTHISITSALRTDVEILYKLIEELQQEVATLKEQLNTIGKNI